MDPNCSVVVKVAGRESEESIVFCHVYKDYEVWTSRLLRKYDIGFVYNFNLDNTGSQSLLSNTQF